MDLSRKFRKREHTQEQVKVNWSCTRGQSLVLFLLWAASWILQLERKQRQRSSIGKPEVARRLRVLRSSLRLSSFSFSPYLCLVHHRQPSSSSLFARCLPLFVAVPCFAATPLGPWGTVPRPILTCASISSRCNWACDGTDFMHRNFVKLKSTKIIKLSTSNISLSSVPNHIKTTF